MSPEDIAFMYRRVSSGEGVEEEDEDLIDVSHEPQGQEKSHWYVKRTHAKSLRKGKNKEKKCNYIVLIKIQILI